MDVRKRAKSLALIIALFFLVYIFYGRTTQTWFQQDEWEFIGKYAYLNSIDPFPPLKAFLWNLFPHPRFSFAPLSESLFAFMVHIFELNFTPYAYFSIILHALNSFLVYILVSRIAKNKKLGVIASVIFAINGRGQKVITWILTSFNTGGAALFSILALITLDNYIKKKKTKYLSLAVLLVFIGMWFKETTVAALFAIYIFILVDLFLSKAKKIHLKALLAFTLFFFFYVLLRFSLSIKGAQIHTDYVDLLRPLYLREYFSLVLWTPIRSVVNVFILPSALYKIAYILTPLVRPELSNFRGTTEFGKFAETHGVDLTTIILLLPIMFVIRSIYKLVRNNPSGHRKLFQLSISLVLSSIIIKLMLSVRGPAVLTHTIRSRDLYISTIGSSSLVAMLVYYYWQKANRAISKILIIGIVFAYLLYNWNYINNVVLATEIEKASLRKNIVSQIYFTYPVLPKRTVFFTQSDTPYYGSEVPSLPFQTGFGRTLLVWYSLKSKNIDYELMNNGTFLYLPHSQGYQEIGKYGFGYFTEFEKLQETISQHTLPVNSVFAFSYHGKLNTLNNITQETRERLIK